MSSEQAPHLRMDCLSKALALHTRKQFSLHTTGSSDIKEPDIAQILRTAKTFESYVIDGNADDQFLAYMKSLSEPVSNEAGH